MSDYKWKPLQRAYGIKPPAPDLIATYIAAYKCSEEEAVAKIRKESEGSEFWINDLFQVEVRRDQGEWIHICIRRRDGAARLRDWRHFQQIKNEVVGPEYEAVELYPAESRLVDTSNKYHLWAYAKEGARFPFGYQDRAVIPTEISTNPGLRQRRI